MLVKLNKRLRTGEPDMVLVAVDDISTCQYVEHIGLTAVNLKNPDGRDHPTVWVIESPAEIYNLVQEGTKT